MIFGTVDRSAYNATGQQVTEVTVEANRVVGSQTVASFPLGSAGTSYVLPIPVESGLPLANPLASQEGDALEVVVQGASSVLDRKTFVVARGQIVRLNFGFSDTDGNSLSDDWEQRYFSRLGVDPNADPDGDGFTNLQESQQGTHPLAHPADANPADMAMTIFEVTAYGQLWKAGQPMLPRKREGETDTDYAGRLLNYVTRAGFLWKNGEGYRFDQNAASEPPGVWVPATMALASQSNARDSVPRTRLMAQSKPAPEGAEATEQEGARREMPRSYQASQTFSVTVMVRPAPKTSVYAVQENVPDGWQVSEVSEAGQFDQPAGTVRWGLFFDDQARTLTYRITPTDEAARVVFEGVASFDGRSLPTSGVREAFLNGALAKLIGRWTDRGTGFEVVLYAEPSRDYHVDASVDLVTWETVGEVKTDATGEVRFTDPQATATVRFYRALPVERDRF
ncbi:MAG: hypothetical protein L0Z50_12480 [Verrucomicrobiales bacterium]|nr:hypothetical protein [Verrucomicrobiales bacterium]